jgi:hypothetical protein
MPHPREETVDGQRRRARYPRRAAVVHDFSTREKIDYFPIKSGNHQGGSWADQPGLYSSRHIQVLEYRQGTKR